MSLGEKIKDTGLLPDVKEVRGISKEIEKRLELLGPMKLKPGHKVWEVSKKDFDFRLADIEETVEMVSSEKLEVERLGFFKGINGGAFIRGAVPTAEERKELNDINGKVPKMVALKKKRIIVKSDCFYVSALNEKNFARKLKKIIFG